MKIGLEERIQDELVTDSEDILDSNLESVKKILQIHKDGTIDISQQYREVEDPDKTLIYVIGQFYGHKGGLKENDFLTTKEVADLVGVTPRSIRNYMDDLRSQGFVKTPEKGKHRLVPENLPDAMKYLEDNYE